MSDGVFVRVTVYVDRYGLADNEDNIPDIIRIGALQRLMECSEKLSVQVRVGKTLTRTPQLIPNITCRLQVALCWDF